MPLLPALPAGDPGAVVAWVAEHLGDLTAEGPDRVRASGRFPGGQRAADSALAAFDVTGYARRRNQVWPQDARGASALSPWIRHGLLPLREVWDHVAGGPSGDVRKFRDELLWQEYARHLYARLGTATRSALRHDAPTDEPRPDGPDDPASRTAPWSRDMACLDLTVGELERDGWLVNQTRMWLSSHWTVREGWGWRPGEDAFFTHLLDGSRAANRLGWQWTVGAGSAKAYGFSRWQVRKRAPGLCDGCALRDACPIEDWPDTDHVGSAAGRVAEPDPRLRRDEDPEATAGPSAPAGDGPVEAVWLTAESLGSDDPALAAHPDAPAVFCFDEPLLRRLRLSGKRLVFLAQTLAELGEEREVRVSRGRVVQELAGTPLAVTHAPVPGFGLRASRLDVAVRHPWPWLVVPHAGPVTSFSAWRKAAGRRLPR
ncbi:deoxyribodipyrimidine photolyase [Phycicoccus sp. BSK3Z-2]|uniref:Deoxyribodipyrimidine photolyase n=1 Tax=Phycicoccus avicenniae TaxID=2828860 RepID=A0A941D8F3_9MICO|nr:FAD-binding domain-containing protein [Phycicoccus avicenniae]MBR7743680.1 deoxyribodipyrimidine photolyase [Phycicoccus avicenniae]